MRASFVAPTVPAVYTTEKLLVTLGAINESTKQTNVQSSHKQSSYSFKRMLSVKMKLL